MGGLVLIAALLALPPPPAARAAAAVPAPAGEQPLCRSLADTGSRLARRRICMTRQGWAEYRRLQRAELERMQVNGGIPGAE